MTARTLRFLAIASILGGGDLSRNVYADVVIATDNASQTAYNDGWAVGDNGGLGFAAWSTINNQAGSGSGGGFHTSGNANSQIATSGESFGVFGNGGGVGQAMRSFSNAMVVNDRFSIDMDNGSIDGGGTVGFGLQNSSGNNLFEFFFVGGEGSYKVFSAAGSIATGVTFTNTGLRLQLLLTGASSFSFTIDKIADGIGTNVTTVNGNLQNPAGGQAIARMRLFNANAGFGGDHDAFYNSFEVAAVPEASAFWFGGLATSVAVPCLRCARRSVGSFG